MPQNARWPKRSDVVSVHHLHDFNGRCFEAACTKTVRPHAAVSTKMWRQSKEIHREDYAGRGVQVEPWNAGHWIPAKRLTCIPRPEPAGTTPVSDRTRSPQTR